VAGVEIDDMMVDQIETVGDIMRIVEEVRNTLSGAMLGETWLRQSLSR
jgi:hypothetical protein